MTTAGPRPIYLRWYVLVGVPLIFLLVVAAAIFTPLSATLRFPYRNFYIPAEAMRPTLEIDDRLLAQMHVPSQLRRGMIVLFDVGDSIYIKRIAALPGDRVEFVDGEFVLNGRIVPRRQVGREPTVDPAYGQAPLRFTERFPGEPRSHQILDSGYSQLDDVAEQVVRPGHVFVLGDNRDHSADSRVPREEMGVEQLPIADIRGVPLFIYWRRGVGFVNEPLAD